MSITRLISRRLVRGIIYLIDLGVKKRQENDNHNTHQGEHAESDVAVNPEVGAGYQVNVDMEKTDTSGDEENEPENQYEYKHI
jgi:hypothetical protein